MLKTNYKDALFDGQRRYRQVPNEDGTISMIDNTTYTQAGDRFGANDINATNAEINRIGNGVVLTLSAGSWAGPNPYYAQRVTVAGCKDTDIVHVYAYTPAGIGSAASKLRKKMHGMLTDVISENGSVVFYCEEKRPTADFPVLIEGVSV